MIGVGRWLPSEPGKPLPPDSRVEKWRGWIDGGIRSEVITVF
jgi:hypothetical protein